jgi:hypothetical protein
VFFGLFILYIALPYPDVNSSFASLCYTLKASTIENIVINAAGKILLTDLHLATEVKGECHCPDAFFLDPLLCGTGNVASERRYE